MYSLFNPGLPPPSGIPYIISVLVWLTVEVGIALVAWVICIKVIEGDSDERRLPSDRRIELFLAIFVVVYIVANLLGYSFYVYSGLY